MLRFRTDKSAAPLYTPAQTASTTAETASDVSAVEPSAAVVTSIFFGKADVHIFRVILAVMFPFALFYVAASVLFTWMVPTPSVAVRAIGAVAFLMAFAPRMRFRHDRKNGEGGLAFPAPTRSLLCGVGMLLFAAGLLLFPSTRHSSHFPPDTVLGGLLLFIAALQFLIAFALWPRAPRNR